MGTSSMGEGQSAEVEPGEAIDSSVEDETGGEDRGRTILP